MPTSAARSSSHPTAPVSRQPTSPRLRFCAIAVFASWRPRCRWAICTTRASARCAPRILCRSMRTAGSTGLRQASPSGPSCPALTGISTRSTSPAAFWRPSVRVFPGGRWGSPVPGTWKAMPRSPLSTWAPGECTAALGILTGQLALHADASGFTARGSVVPTGLHVGPFDGEFDGSFAKHVLTVKHVDLTHRSSGAQASGSGTIGIVHGGPRLDLQGSWQSFRWPLVGKDVPFRSASGNYSIAGTLPYAVQLDGLATVNGLPQIPARVAGTLGEGSLRVQASRPGCLRRPRAARRRSGVGSGSEVGRQRHPHRNESRSPAQRSSRFPQLRHGLARAFLERRRLQRGGAQHQWQVAWRPGERRRQTDAHRRNLGIRRRPHRIGRDPHRPRSDGIGEARLPSAPTRKRSVTRMLSRASSTCALASRRRI